MAYETVIMIVCVVFLVVVSVFVLIIQCWCKKHNSSRQTDISMPASTHCGSQAGERTTPSTTRFVLLIRRIRMLNPYRQFHDEMPPEPPAYDAKSILPPSYEQAVSGSQITTTSHNDQSLNTIINNENCIVGVEHRTQNEVISENPQREIETTNQTTVTDADDVELLNLNADPSFETSDINTSQSVNLCNNLGNTLESPPPYSRT